MNRPKLFVPLYYKITTAKKPNLNTALSYFTHWNPGQEKINRGLWGVMEGKSETFRVLLVILVLFQLGNDIHANHGTNIRTSIKNKKTTETSI